MFAKMFWVLSNNLRGVLFPKGIFAGSLTRCIWAQKCTWYMVYDGYFRRKHTDVCSVNIVHGICIPLKRHRLSNGIFAKKILPAAPWVRMGRCFAYFGRSFHRKVMLQRSMWIYADGICIPLKRRVLLANV